MTPSIVYWREKKKLLKKNVQKHASKRLLRTRVYTRTIGNVPSVTNQRTMANNLECRTSRLLRRLGALACLWNILLVENAAPPRKENENPSPLRHGVAGVTAHNKPLFSAPCRTFSRSVSFNKRFCCSLKENIGRDARRKCRWKIRRVRGKTKTKQ